MKQYKHRITGNIATETQSESNYKVSEPRNFTVPKWIIENSSDWEEVIERKFLFQTVDGVDIYEGDKYYSVHASTFEFPNGYGVSTIKGTAAKGYWDTFSTLEKAQEYINLNKPKYSFNDIKNVLNEQMYKPYASLVLLDLKKLNK